jgi:hypothetical protein
LPVYSTKNISNQDFYAAFKVSPSSLGFSDDKITEVNLSCSEGTDVLGSTLIFQENGNTYTLVDGTFLKLEKTL